MLKKIKSKSVYFLPLFLFLLLALFFNFAQKNISEPSNTQYIEDILNEKPNLKYVVEDSKIKVSVDESRVEFDANKDFKKFKGIENVKSKKFATDIVHVNTSGELGGLVILKKNRPVINRLYYCKEFNNEICVSGWERLNIDFEQNATHVWFYVKHFSAYVGDYVKNDFDLGTYNNTYYNTTLSAVRLNNTFSSGTFTSEVFDSGSSNATWLNISWTSNETLNKYLNFSVRSCNDFSCSGENYSSLNNTNPQILNVTNNRYFQYKTIFTTNSTNSTQPYLNDVSIWNNVTLSLKTWTLSDTQTTYSNHTKIFANYTIDLIPITSATCTLYQNKTGVLRKHGNLKYNSSSKLYEAIADNGYLAGHIDSMSVGTYGYQVNCIDGTYSNKNATNTTTIDIYNTSLVLSNSGIPVLNEQTTFYANYSSDWFPVSGVGLNRYEIGDVIWENIDTNPRSSSTILNLDLDGDGYRDEIIADDYDLGNKAQIDAFSENGSLLFTSNSISSSYDTYTFAASDIDNDSREEFLTTHYYGDFVVFNETGGIILSMKPSSGRIYNAFFMDLDGQGIKNDILVGANGGGLFAYNSTDGKSWDSLWNSTSLGFSDVNEISFGDLTHDGVNEIITTTDSTVYIFNISGSSLWNYTTGSGYTGASVVLDLDNDGFEDDVAVARQNILYYFNETGGVLNTIPLVNVVSDLKKFDYYLDGTSNEIVLTLSTAGFYTEIYNSTSKIKNLFQGTADPSVIRIADVNSDGYNDIIFGDDASIIRIFNSTGSFRKKYNLNDGSIPTSDQRGARDDGLKVGDINHDGLFDIIATTSGANRVILQEVSCVANFNDSTSYNMTWNNSMHLWEMNRTFPSASTYSYNISCSKGGYETQLTSTNITPLSDVTPPTIQFITPTPVNNYIQNYTRDITIKVNGFDWNLANVTLEWNGVNESMSCSGSPIFSCSITKSNLINGNYTYLVYANDSFGNSNFTEQRTVRINEGESLLSGTFMKTNFVSTRYSFLNGTFNQTYFEDVSDVVELNSSYNNGTFTSEIFDSGDVSTVWDNISWDGIGDVSGGLVGLWHFNNDNSYGENSTKIHDFSGNEHNGTCSGGTCPSLNSSGKLDSDYTYVADSNYFSVQDSTDFTLSNDYTVSAWINPDNIGTDYKAFVGTYDGQGFIFSLRSNVINELSFWTGSGSWKYSGQEIKEDGTWKYVVYTKNGTIGTFYLDGKLVSTVTAGAGTDGGELQIGAGGTSWAPYRFDGSIDEVSLWNRSLSSQEVQKLYQRGINNFNLSVRSCDDVNCIGESFVDINNTPFENLSVLDNRYFQYGVDFKTNNVNLSPTLSNVSISYTLPPQISLSTYSLSDTQTTYSNYTKIFANYTADLVPITTATCTLYHNKTGVLRKHGNLKYNSSSKLYEAIADNGYLVGHIDSMPVGTYGYQVNCIDGAYSDKNAINTTTINVYNTSLVLSNSLNPLVNQTTIVYANYSSDWFPVSGVGLNRYEIGDVIWNTSDLGSDTYFVRFADLDKDGYLDEIVTASLDNIYAYNKTGIRRWTYSDGAMNKIFLGYVEDMNLDGFKNELLANSNSQGLLIFNGSGEIVEQISELKNTWGGIELAVGDFDRDGNKNDIASGASGEIRVYNTSDEINWKSLWNSSNQGLNEEIIVGDFDKDGYDDISLTTSTGRFGDYVYAYNGNNGSLIWNTVNFWEYVLALNKVDIDNDGYEDEVIMGRSGVLRGYEFNGTYGVTYPASSLIFTATVTRYINEIIVGDLDDDGNKDDILIGDSGSDASGPGVIRAFNNDSINLWNYTLPSKGIADYIYTLIWDDINNDGNNEAIFSNSVSPQAIRIVDKNGTLKWDYELGLGTIGTSRGKAQGISLGDVNYDGIKDIGVASFNGYVHILQQVNCIANFADSTSYNMTWNNSIHLWQVNKTFSSVGLKNYNVSCSKGGYESQLLISGSLNVSVDTVSPLIQFVTPTTNSSSSSQDLIFVNVSANDETLLDSIVVNLYNSTGNLINSTTSLISPLSTNFTGLLGGTYYFNATANDTSGNINSSETRTVIIDNTNPQISFVTPTPANNSILNYSYVDVNVSINDNSQTSAYINWNNDLLGYWSFENSNSTTVFDDSIYGNDADFSNGANVSSLNKIRGKSGEFDGSGIQSTISNLDSNALEALRGNSNFTFSAFFNTKVRSTTSSHIEKIFEGLWVLGSKIEFYVYSAWGSEELVMKISSFWKVDFITTGDINWKENKWNHYAFTYSILANNTGNASIYFNGILKNSIILNRSRFNQNINNFYIAGAGDYFNGSLDEVMIFNRSLSSQEIGALYNSSQYSLQNNFSNLSNGNYNYKSCAIDVVGNRNCTQMRSVTINVFVDTYAPNITFTSPTTNTSNITKNWIFVNVSTQDYSLDTVLINLYNSTNNLINSTFSTITPLSINFTGLLDGTYYFNSTANDTSGNSNYTETRTVTIDTSNPKINFITPTTNTSNQSNTWIYANVSAVDLNLDRIVVNLYNGSGSLINSTQSPSNPLSINFTSLIDGTYYFNSTAKDTFGNINFTETRVVTIDTSNPKIQFITPTTNTSNTSQNWIFANVSANDMSLDTLLVNLYNSSGELINSSFSNNSILNINFTSLVDGTYYFNSTANDTSGNSNYTETRTVTIDTSNPKINFITPTTNTSNSSQNWIYVNVSANDMSLDTLLVNLYNSTFDLINSTSSGGTTPLQINFSNLVDGTYYFNATTNDTSGNSNYTETRTVTIDTSNPKINFITPTTNSSNQSLTWIYVNLSVFDISLDTVSINIYNSTFNLINTTSLIQINFTSLVDGIYYLNATANDTFGNTNSTETRIIIIDNTNPQISFVAPTTNTSNQSLTWIFANVSANDASLNKLIINLYNSTFDLINSTSSGTAPLQINFSNLVDGTYYINATVNDSLGNSNSTKTRTIKIDTSNPQISFGVGTTPSGNNKNNYISSNIIVIDSLIDTITVNLYDFNGSLFRTSSSSISPLNINFTSLPDGTYYLNSTANDTFNNRNSTSTRTIMVDNSTPTINLVSPTTSTGAYQINYLYANVSASDFSLDTIILYLYDQLGIVSTQSSNVSPLYFNFTGLTEGTYYLNATVNDSIGRISSTLTNKIILDSTPPIVSLLNPANNSYNNITSNVNFQFQVSDLEDITSCSLIVNGQNEKTSSNITKDINQSIDYGLFNGINNWTISCVDIAGNVGNSTEYNIEINITPTVILNFPTNNFFSLSSSLSFNCSAISGNGLKNLTFYNDISGSFVPITTSSILGTEDSYVWNLNNINDGKYLWNCFAYDNSNNSAFSPNNFTFTIDTKVPDIYFVVPSTTSGLISSNWIIATINSTEENIDNVTLNFYNNSGQLISTHSSNTVPLGFNLTSLNDGIYYVNATINDSVGQFKSTPTRNITLDSTPPSIFFNNKTTKDGNYSQNWIYINVSNIDLHRDSLTLYIYNSSNLTQIIGSSLSPFMFNFTAPRDGIYKINATAQDLAGNMNSSISKVITLDSTPPNVTLGTPINNFNTSSSNINLTCLATDSFGITNLSLYHNIGGNWTLNQSIAFNLSQNVNYTWQVNNIGVGSYSWNCLGEDFVSNKAFSLNNNSFNRIINNVSYNLFYPLNTSKINDTLKINFTYSVSNKYFNNLNCSLYVDNSSVSNFNLNNNTVSNTTLLLADETNHTYQISCDDTLNITSSPKYIFELNFTPVIIMNYSQFDMTTTTNFSNLSKQQLAPVNYSIFENKFGKIEYLKNISIYRNLDLTNKIQLEKNKTFVDSASIPEFNMAANIYFYNITFTTPQILKNGILCLAPTCNQLSYINNTAAYNVSSFSTYTLKEAPTCSDHIQNQDETGVDCGGLSCFACSSSSTSSSTTISNSFSTLSNSTITNKGGTCKEEWSCIPWSECKNNVQKRTCIAITFCNSVSKRPQETKTCGEIIVNPNISKISQNTIKEENSLLSLITKPVTKKEFDKRYNIIRGIYVSVAILCIILINLIYYRNRDEPEKAKKFITKFYSPLKFNKENLLVRNYNIILIMIILPIVFLFFTPAILVFSLFLLVPGIYFVYLLY